jgi:type IV pilus assembly protein PilM
MFNVFIKKSIGIDIADHSLEVVELIKIGKTIKVKNLGRQELPAGIVKNGVIIKKDELKKILQDALVEAKPHPIAGKKIVFGFPESQTYTHVFSCPVAGASTAELDKMVLEEAWANIPITKSEMLVEYEIVTKEKDRIDVLIVAAPKRVVSGWQKFFEELGMEIVAFDIEPIANFRNLEARHKKDIMLVDIGSATTNIYIFQRDKLVYEHTVNVAGDDLTKEVAAALNIETADAEGRKRATGLSDTETPFFAAIVKALGEILNEINNSLKNYSDKHKTQVASIIFIGGSSQLKGLLEYFSANLKVPVTLGTPRIYQSKEMEYLGAIGMALRGLYRKYDQADPFIPFANQEKENQTEDVLTTIGFNASDNQHLEEPLANNKKSMQSKKKMLIIVLLVGVVLLGVAYSYRLHEQQAREAEIKNATSKLENLPVVEEPIEVVATTTTNVASSTNNIATSTENVVGDNSNSTTTAEIDNSTATKVVVQDTEVGYLNVREGAGTTFKILTKVKPGEIYELLEEKGEWAKIKVSVELSGWVANKYVKKQEN